METEPDDSAAGGFEQVQTIDGPAVVREIVRAGGPRLELRVPLAGGAVGAWLVRWEDGHDSVLTWSPPLRDGQLPGAFDRAVAMMELAAAAGVPIPRYESVIALADGGLAVLQEYVAGVTPDVVTPALVEQLIDLTECRRGLVEGTPFAGQEMPLYLRSAGPGFCVHEPLRQHGASTASLLDVIEATVDADDDRLPGADVVHLDFHIGKVLVDPRTPERVAAIIDWDGAGPGLIELDLAILAFDLTWRAPGPVQHRVELHLLENTDERLFAKVWAHASLRLLDWTIRHHPQDIDHRIAVSSRHLPV